MEKMKVSYKALVEEAIYRLETDDELFVDMVNELDNWNGFADGFRAFPMYEIDELFCGVSIGDFLDKLSPSFNHRDEYFTDTIYGIDSTDDIAAWYRDYTSAGEVFDEIISHYNDIWINDKDFDALIDDIINYESLYVNDDSALEAGDE